MGSTTRISLWAKLFFAVVVFALLFLMATLIPIVAFLKIKASNDFYNSMHIELQYIQTHFSSFTKNINKLLYMLSIDDNVKTANSELPIFINNREDLSFDQMPQTVKAKALRKFFLDVSASYPEFAEVYMGTSDGGFISSDNGKRFAGYDPRKRDWYKIALSADGLPGMTKAYLSATGDLVVSICRTVTLNKKTIGCVAIDVSLKSLTDTIEAVNLQAGSNLILVQDDGTILANPTERKTNFKNLSSFYPVSYDKLSEYLVLESKYK